jgi:hypothetical protein
LEPSPDRELNPGVSGDRDAYGEMVSAHSRRVFAVCQGATAQVGDSTSVICWWRPRNSDDYRAIYGDFRVDEVSPDRCRNLDTNDIR